MRKISEITVNGKALQEILDAHYKWLTTSTMEGRADLRSADLSDAVLSGAVLIGANLIDAVLSGAVLSGAKNVPDYVRAVTCILPEGPIIGWKKCNDNIVMKMQIPAKARRSNATARWKSGSHAKDISRKGQSCFSKV